MNKYIKKNTKTIILIAIFLPLVAFGNSFKISDYQFVKNIEFPTTSSGNFGDYYFEVDEKIYKNTDGDLQNISIASGEKILQHNIFKEKDKVVSKNITQDLEIFSEEENEYVLALDSSNQPNYDYNKIDLYIETQSKDFLRIADLYVSNLPDQRFEKVSSEEGILIEEERIIFLSDMFDVKDKKFLKIVFSGNEGEFVPEKFSLKRYYKQIEKELKVEVPINFEDFKLEDLKKQAFLVEVLKENYPVREIKISSNENLSDYKYNLEIYYSEKKDSIFLEPNKRFDKNKSYWKKLNYRQININEFSVSKNAKFYLVFLQKLDDFGSQISSINLYNTKENIIFSTKNLTQDEIQNLKVYYGRNISSHYRNLYVDEQKAEKIFLSKQIENKIYVPKKESLLERNKYIFYVGIVLIFLFLVFLIISMLKQEKNISDTN